MRHNSRLIIFFTIILLGRVGFTQDFPSVSISNPEVTMKIYLPDPEKGYYRATRFDWSGLISSLEWNGHQYFGQWKSTHDPLVHEDLPGPVEASVMPGLGYEEAPAGGTFIRLGVGVLEKPDEKEYQWMKTYKILDHGRWKIRKGKDWIEFRHQVTGQNGYGYRYIKRIRLKTGEPGFIISHSLKNTGSNRIQTDQFNHNFFMIDGEQTGRNFVVRYPFVCTTESDLKGMVTLEKNELTFLKDLENGSVWMELKGYSQDMDDHQVTVVNTKTGAGVMLKVNKPLYRMVFWACHTTLCPENFIWLDIPPGVTEKWDSDYTLFEAEK